MMSGSDGIEIVAQVEQRVEAGSSPWCGSQKGCDGWQAHENWSAAPWLSAALIHLSATNPGRAGTPDRSRFASYLLKVSV